MDMLSIFWFCYDNDIMFIFVVFMSDKNESYLVEKLLNFKKKKKLKVFYVWSDIFMILYI